MAPQVLVIDDNRDVGSLIRTLLYRAAGIEVTLAASGSQALTVLHEDQASGIRAVVLDYHLETENGEQVLAQLRAQGFVQPVIFCSASLDPALAQKLRALGAFACVDKLGMEDTLPPLVVEALARAPRGG